MEEHDDSPRESGQLVTRGRDERAALRDLANALDAAADAVRRLGRARTRQDASDDEDDVEHETALERAARARPAATVAMLAEGVSLDDAIVEAVLMALAGPGNATIEGTTEDLLPVIERELVVAGHAVPGVPVLRSAKQLGRRLGMIAGRLRAEGLVVGKASSGGRARWTFARPKP